MLGIKEFGWFVLFQSVSLLATAAVTFGYDTALLRDASLGRSCVDPRTILRLKVVTSLLPLAAAAAYFAALDIPSRLAGVAAIVVGGGLLLGMSETPETILAIDHRYSSRAAVQVVPYAAAAGAVLAGGLVGDVRLEFVAALFLLREAGRFGAAFVLSAQDVMERLPQRSVDLLRAAAPFAAISILGNVYGRIDNAILAITKGPEAVAEYGAAFSVYAGFLGISSALGPLLLQRFGRATPGEIVRAIRALGALGLALASGAMILAPVTSILFGQSFQNVPGLVRILVLALPVAFVDSALLRLAFARGLETRTTGALAFVVVVNIALNFLLQPRYGPIGAAASTVMSELALLATLGTLVHRSYERERREQVVQRP